MAVIEDLLGEIDTTVATIGGTIFNSVAAEVLPIVQVGSVLVLALTGANLAIQAIPMTLQNGVSLMLRIALVYVFVRSFNNFDAVYGVLTDAPAEFGAIILNEVTGGSVTNLYAGLDELYGRALDVGDAISQNGSFIAGAIAGVVMFLVAALMAVVSVIMIGGAKLMIGVLIILGPVAVATALFKQSAPFFEAYVKMALGFALVPLLAAAMAGFTIMSAEAVTPSSLSTVDTIGDMVSFIVVMLLGTGLMAMIPSTSSSLAQTGIGLTAAAAATYVQGRKGLDAGKAGTSATGGAIGGAYRAARGQALDAGASRSAKVGHATVSKVQYLANRLRK